MFVFNNDEIIILLFICCGVKKEDVYNYSVIGCVEIVIFGKWGYCCIGMSFINFLCVFLFIMNGGIDFEFGKWLLFDYGKFIDMIFFD